jgi:hypothetical protein
VAVRFLVEMMAESPVWGKAGSVLLAHIVHGTARDPQLARRQDVVESKRFHRLSTCK